MNEADIRRNAGKSKVPVGTIEKDYVLSQMLLILSNLGISSHIVFKGGTAIKKIYYPEARFSEDLDLDYFDIDIGTIKKAVMNIPDINPFESVEFEDIKDEKGTVNSYSCRVNYKGPLGYKNSVKLDFSKRDRILKKIGYKQIIDDYKSWEECACAYLKQDSTYVYLGGIRHTYRCELDKRSRFKTLVGCWKCNMFTLGPEIQDRNGIQTMHLDEILAEKCRALMMRDMPRDLYDIMFLLEKGVNFNVLLIHKKLERYEEKWDNDSFEEKLDILEVSWKRDLEGLLPKVPDFNLVADMVKSKISF